MTDAPRPRRRQRQSWLVAGAVWFGLLAMMLAWAFASPVSSGPDESGHIMKAAATVRGDAEGSATDQEGIRSFRLPADVGDAGGDITCFAGQPDQSAACAPSLGSRSSRDVDVESGVAAYNPIYYVLVGWPSLFLTGAAEVEAMRMINAVIVATLWTVAFLGLCFRRPWRIPFVALPLTPMAIYLGGVVNPSGVEVAATAATVALTALAVTREGPAPHHLAIGLGVVAGLLVNLRSISPLFAALAIGVVFLAVGLRRSFEVLMTRPYLITGAALVPVLAFAVWWSIAISGPVGYIPSAGSDRPGRVEAFWTTLQSFDHQLTEMIGVLGWLDSWLPGWVYGLWSALLAAGLIVVLILGRRRVALVVIGVCALGMLVPAVLQAATAPQYGYIWQGRYSLPFLVLASLVASLAFRSVPRLIAGRLQWFGLMFTAVQVCAFVVVLKRYSIGADAPWSLWGSGAAWTPAFGTTACITLLAAGCLLLAAAGPLTIRGGRPRIRASSTPTI